MEENKMAAFGIAWGVFWMLIWAFFCWAQFQDSPNEDAVPLLGLIVATFWTFASIIWYVL